MRPFSGKSLTNKTQKIFNYRLSRSHRIIEKTFGILVSLWTIFQRPIEGSPERVEKYTLAAIALHNYLRQTDNVCYTPVGFVDSFDSIGKIAEGNWRNLVDNNLQSINAVKKFKVCKSSN